MSAFVDANVVIHATGTDAVMRERCAPIVAASSRADSRLISSAEVLQEVFWVRQRTHGIEAARFAVQLCVDSFDVVDLWTDDVLRAVNAKPVRGLQARDLVHLATMTRLGITRIITTDHAFDHVEGIERLDPIEFATWRESVFPGD